MNYYSLKFEEFSLYKQWKFDLVDDIDKLNKKIAREVVDGIKSARSNGEKFMVICPVGPLDYKYWADLMNEEKVSGSNLITVNMDDYVDENDNLIPETHPLSFRKFMKENLFDRLNDDVKIPVENIFFPDLKKPGEVTKLLEEHGGADLCIGGFGLTGHFAFNDPPEEDEKCDDIAVRNSKTRKVLIGPTSQAQMCMGGTNGNWDLLPECGITLGMYELLLSKKIHLAFMRSWHAGVLRRALFGPVTGRCPGSFIQEHPNVEVTLTPVAAQLPLVNVSQARGDENSD